MKDLQRALERLHSEGDLVVTTKTITHDPKNVSMPNKACFQTSSITIAAITIALTTPNALTGWRSSK